MAILDDVKISLRISASNTAYDTEITDLINACYADLGIAGVRMLTNTDPLIKRAVNTYVKANFGFDNPDADRLQMSYESLKRSLALAYEYGLYSITFTVVDVDDSAIREASIKLWNDELNYEETIETNASGVAVFYVLPRANFKYNITASGYEGDYHSDDDANLVDVTTADVTVDITLTEV